MPLTEAAETSNHKESKSPMIEVIGGSDSCSDEDDLSDHEDDPIWQLAATVGSTI